MTGEKLAHRNRKDLEVRSFYDTKERGNWLEMSIFNGFACYCVKYCKKMEIKKNCFRGWKH